MTTQANYKIERKTHKIDVAGRPVGRAATEIAQLLRGKGKVSFTRHVDNGDFVVVKNIKEIIFTGKKLEQKKYYRHSGYPGGLKTTKASDLMAKNPAKILEMAIFHMLPTNKLRNAMMKRLTIRK